MPHIRSRKIATPVPGGAVIIMDSAPRVLGQHHRFYVNDGAPASERGGSAPIRRTPVGRPRLSVDDVEMLVKQRLANLRHLSVRRPEVISIGIIRTTVTDPEGTVVLTIDVDRASGGILRAV